MIGQRQADVLGCMSRGMQDLEFDLAHGQAFVVLQGPRPVAQFGTGRGEQFQGATGLELCYSREVVIVLMGIRGIGDAYALLTGKVVVIINFPAHIKHQCLTGLLRADKVRSVSEAWFIELLEDHSRCLPLSRCTTRICPSSFSRTVDTADVAYLRLHYALHSPGLPGMSGSKCCPDTTATGAPVLPRLSPVHYRSTGRVLQPVRLNLKSACYRVRRH